MTTPLTHYADKKYQKERQEGHTNIREMAYVAGQGATLASLNLEQGDVFPEDSDYYIVNSEIRMDKDGGSRFAVVVAVNYDAGP